MKQTVKTRSGRVLVLPTPAEDAAIAAGIAQDPETYEPDALELGMMRQHGIGCSLGADGALNLRPAPGNRKDFDLELARDTPALPIGTSVIELLRQEACY